MATWLEQLLPASFRGVPFQVDTIEHQAGDNVVLREYPFQDLPTVFRMGEAAEEIKFFDFAFKDGKKMAEELDYVPMPDKTTDFIRKNVFSKVVTK